MDKNYLKNMQGSPYVDEGLWDRIKSRGSAGVQQLKGMTDKGWTPLDERKLESLWKSFTTRIGRLIKDFNANVVPNIKTHRKADLVTFKDDINKFKTLGKFFIPKSVSQPRKKSTASTATSTTYGMAPPTSIAPDDYSGTSGWTSSPSISEIIKEANFSSLYLPSTILRAKASNNTKITIDAYKSEFKRMYDEFIKDVSIILFGNLEKVPVVDIDKMISDKNPKWNSFLKAWKNAAGIPIENIPSGSPKQPSATPPDVETGKVPDPVPSKGEPSSSPMSSFRPKIVGEPPPMDPSKFTYSTPKGGFPIPPDKSSSASNPTFDKPKDGENKNNNYIDTEVMRKVIDLVINVIREDPQSRRYFNKNLSDWKWDTSSKTNVPPVTHTTLNEEDDEDVETMDEPARDPKYKEKFLYKFRTLFSKHTGNFVIGLGVFKHNENTFEVQWHSFGGRHGYNNEINVNVYVPENGTSQENVQYKKYHITLFSFYDHETDPRTLVGKNFSIKNIFIEANPSKVNEITPEVESLFSLKKDEFQKALFAVTDRKAMEHQVHLPPVGKAARDRLMPEEGWNEDKATQYIQRAIILLGSKGTTSEILVARAKKIRESEGLLAAKMWNADMIQKYIDKAIKQLGLDGVTDQILAQRAIQLRQEDLDVINTDPIRQDPRFNQLVGAMVNLGHKQKESEKYVENFLKTQNIPDNISIRDLTFSLLATVGKDKDKVDERKNYINPFVSSNFLD